MANSAIKSISRALRRPLLRDLLSSSATGIFIMAAVLAITRLIANGLGAERFGEFAIARRLVTFLMPLVTLGISQALTYYVAGSKKTEAPYYLRAGITLGVILPMVVATAGWTMRDQVSYLLFGTDANAPLVGAALFNLATASLLNTHFAYLRGADKIIEANIWQILLDVFIPLAAAIFVYRAKDLSSFFILVGLAQLILLAPLAKNAQVTDSNAPPTRLLSRAKELLEYGIPRLGTGFAFMSLVSVGPFLAPRLASIATAGHLVLGLTFLRIADLLFSAAGIVILPRAARLKAERRNDDLKKHVRNSLRLTVSVGAFIATVTYVCAGRVIILWLGEGYETAVDISRLLAPSLLPYTVYVGLRSFIDAAEIRPINLYNLLAALGACFFSIISISFFSAGGTALAVGTTIGFIVLGLLTITHSLRSYDLQGLGKEMIGDIGPAVTGGIAMLLIAYALGPAPSNNWIRLMELGLIIGVGAGISSMHLILFRGDWLKAIVSELKAQ